MNCHVTFYARFCHVTICMTTDHWSYSLRRLPQDFIGPGVRVCFRRRFIFFSFSSLIVTANIMAGDSLVSVVSKFYDSYMVTTPKRLKIVDAYLLYILLTGVIQFVYCCLVGTFPFNSFLSGFVSCVGSFVLGGMHLFTCTVINILSAHCHTVEN